MGISRRYGTVLGSAGGDLCCGTYFHCLAAGFREEIKNLEWITALQDELEIALHGKDSGEEMNSRFLLHTLLKPMNPDI